MMIESLVMVLLGVAPQAVPPRVLTLEEALNTARTRQPQIRQAAAATQAAAARADQAFAPLLPQVSGSASYQRATSNSVTGAGGESWETSNSFNFGLNANQLLYDFGQARNRWKSSQAGVSSQQESERSTLNQVCFSVRTAYFQARAAKALISVASETLANQQRHMEQTEGFVEVGTQAPIALAQAKTTLANARVQLITAENSYATGKAQLNLAMGVEGPTDYDVADESLPTIEGEDGTTENLVAEAIKGRPELAALAHQVQGQELTVKALEGAYWPSLGASTGFTDGGGHISGLTWNWNVGVNLSVPVFRGGQPRAQVREAQANLLSLRSQLDLQRQQIRLEVEQARLAVRAAKAALGATGEALESASEQLRLAEGRYETGVGSMLELNDAQVAVTNAGQQRVQAEYVLAQARAQLVKALSRN